MLNACPQRLHNNAGIWLDMEVKTEKWANEFDSIWVICGPVFDSFDDFIGEVDKGEFLIAVPDAFFKIIVREIEGELDVLSFIFPQDTHRKDKDHLKYAVSVDEIEERTGLEFFTSLGNDVEESLEVEKAIKLW